MDYLHYIDRGLVLAHVVTGFIALIVGPIAMLTAKGGDAHRKAGKIYFGGMTGIFVSTLLLAFFRFSPFLYVINIMSFYACFTGYRVLHRRRLMQFGKLAAPIDWIGTAIAALGGIAFVVWGGAGLMGMPLPGYLTHGVPFAFYVIGVVVGALLTLSAVSDAVGFTRQPSDRNWWWYEHMNHFLSGYIATLTAFLVQNVSRRMPQDIAWLVWILPGLIGGFLISRWIAHYRRQFNAHAASKAVSSLTA